MTSLPFWISYECQRIIIIQAFLEGWTTWLFTKTDSFSFFTFFFLTSFYYQIILIRWRSEELWLLWFTTTRWFFLFLDGRNWPYIFRRYEGWFSSQFFLDSSESREGSRWHRISPQLLTGVSNFIKIFFRKYKTISWIDASIPKTIFRSLIGCCLLIC